MKQQKITVYLKSDFGYKKFEGRLVKQGTRDYAQYKDAPFVQFIPKRKRTPVWFIRQEFIILEGWNHPDTEEIYTKEVVSGGVSTSMSKFSSFDPEWYNRFDLVMEDYINENNPAVLCDTRGNFS